MRTTISNNSRISADRIPVDSMVYAVEAHILVMHVTDDLLERFHVERRISIKLDVSDVACVLKSMVWCFHVHLVLERGLVVNRNSFYRHLRGTLTPLWETGVDYFIALVLR